MATTPNLNLMQAASTTFIDVEGEMDFWRLTYRDHPAFSPRRNFVDYEIALRIGIEAFVQDPARTFEECRDELEARYDRRTLARPIDWYEAGSAAAAAWHRLMRRHRSPVAPAVDIRAIPGVCPGAVVAS